jgi:SM-20-related protein
MRLLNIAVLWMASLLLSKAFRPLQTLGLRSHVLKGFVTSSTLPKLPTTFGRRSFATTPVIEEAEIIEEEDFMDVVADAASQAAPHLIEGLRGKGWATIDGFLPQPWIETLRREAVDFFNGGEHFEISKSSRFDPTSPDNLITYDKHNVFAMQLNGGEDYYKGPRLHEYIVSTVKTLVPLLSDAFPDAHLNPQMVSNKLAVCTGEGSAYDKHYDNSGYDDTRKVTVLLYFNDKWRPELGGQFRIYGEGDSHTDIEPVAGRMLVFWSDVCVHSVLASQAPDGPADHRYALTLWMTTDSPDFIVRDNAEIKKHFG